MGDVVFPGGPLELFVQATNPVLALSPGDVQRCAGRTCSVIHADLRADTQDRPCCGRDPPASALAETINGLYKAEVIHRRGPRKSA